MDQEREHNDDKLKEEAPTLFGISKEDSFQVPDGYFDDLADNVQQFVEREEARERIRLQEEATQSSENTELSLGQRIAAIFRPRVLIPVLGALVVAFTVFNFWGPNDLEGGPDEVAVILPELTEEDSDMLDDFLLGADLDEGEGSFDEDEEYILAAFTEENVDKLLEEESKLDNDEEDELIEYLIDNDIDLETIIDEL